MKLLFLVVCFGPSFSHAGFLNEIVGTYKTRPEIPDVCEKNNSVVKCDDQIESMEIQIVDPSKMAISVIVNEDPLHPLSVGCANHSESEGSRISHSTVVETDEMILCAWVTNSAPFLPSLRRIVFKKFNASVIEFQIDTEFKGDLFGKFYRQNGVFSILGRH